MGRRTLSKVRDLVPWLGEYSVSGVRRYLLGFGIRLRSAAVQQRSPDPAYAAKEARLLGVLREAAARPGAITALFLDEMGLHRWPEPCRDWAPAAPEPQPVAEHGDEANRQWRIAGAMDAVSGRVHHLDGYIVGRKQLIEFYTRLARAYPDAERVYVVQDNWSVHRHDDVLAAVAALPTIEPVWLPTYAPWLNPIEKLWRWLRSDVLKLHRLADDWPALLASVRAFLDRFADGSGELLRYAGLAGDGKLAEALRSP